MGSDGLAVYDLVVSPLAETCLVCTIPLWNMGTAWVNGAVPLTRNQFVIASPP